MDWAKDTLQKILAACMTLNQSFYNFCTDSITSNHLLTGGPLHLSEKRIKEQIFNNIMEDLQEKLEESHAELETLNAFPLQKWLNTISKVDVKIAKALEWNMKCVVLELEKEEKKKRNLPGPSCTTDTNSRGCFKCCCLYADHIGCNCPDNFLDTHVMITPVLAAVAKAEWEKHCQSKGQPFNWGQAPSTSAPAVAAIVKDTSEISSDEGDINEEGNSGIVTMTWPSAVALWDSDSDDSILL